ncbi:MAG: hypothetical protein Q7R98_03120 [Candidatus Jorgensenbacteria bacterium]|nr:hypothetical protein [Candidatus Jorgensenbacteria bacterium]
MKKFFKVIGTVLLTGVIGALITEYVLKVGTLGMSNFKYLIIAGVVLGVIVFFVSKRKVSYSIAVFIGALLIPYFAFGVGQIDFYMVDDNLAQGITVVEVRPTMDKIVFGTPDKGDVAVWSGPQTLQLHPGENRVKLGRFNIPADTYKGGMVSIGDIQVDIKADLTIMTDPISGQSIPADRYEEAFSNIKNRMTGSVGGFNIKLMNSALNGSVGTFTISVGSMKQPLPIPEFKYPGMGGPDITLDITLDEMGKPDPSKIKAIVDMPPGVGGAFPSMPGVEFN